MKSNQKRNYRIAVGMVTVLLTLPFAYCFVRVGENVAWQIYHRQSLFPAIPGLTPQHISYSEFSYGTVWRGQFVLTRPDFQKNTPKPSATGLIVSTTVDDWKVDLVDSETGTSKETKWELWASGGVGFTPRVVGDRLLFCGFQHQFEVVDDVLKPLDFPFRWDTPILLNDEIARLFWSEKAGQFIVSNREPTGWVEGHSVVLPSSSRVETGVTSTTQVSANPRLEYLHRDGIDHVFLNRGGQLYYREGLPLQPVDAPGGQGRQDSSQADAVAGAEAVTVTTDEGLVGWSLVRNEPGDSEVSSSGTLFEGRPAALIVDRVRSGYPVGHFYKFDGNQWSEVVSITFPFGSNRFRVITGSAEKSPYIVAETSTGTGFAYVIEPTGLRQVKRTGAAETWKHVKRNLLRDLAGPAIAMAFSVLPGLGIWLLMAWWTKSAYEFGLQTVTLASIGRRGLARVIDLAWIIFSTIGWGLILTRNFDWLSLAESVKRKIDHPVQQTAIQVVTILLIWLIVVIFLMVVIQGVWGVTLGKWLCCLRTLRTTLRPCGFARSLAREVMLVAETGHLLCWLPPMICIAFADYRQRFGDMASDTIVVESRSVGKNKTLELRKETTSGASP